MANLINKTLRVFLKDINSGEKQIKTIKVKKDSYQGKYMSIEDIYFDKYIGCKLPINYNKEELYLAKRLYKCLVVKVYNAKDMSINKKKVYLDEYNWNNLREGVIKTVDKIKEEGLSKKNIVCGDITRIPFDNLFYDFQIDAKAESGEKITKTLKTLITFATGDVEMGYQKGYKDNNGNTVITECKLSSGEPDKCYITINYIRDYISETKLLDEVIAIYYYLGNGYMD